VTEILRKFHEINHCNMASEIAIICPVVRWGSADGIKAEFIL
jgi:hypothetical protein